MSAAFSGFWFLQWARIILKNFGLAWEERIWPPLGWFSELVCVGSIAGAVVWGYNMQTATLDYEANVAGATAGQLYALSATNSRFFAPPLS